MIEPSRDSALSLGQLVAPVDALAIRAVGRLEDELPAHVGDVRIGEVGDEPAQRVRRPGRVRIGEGDDLAARLAHGPVLGGHLASTWVHDQPDAGREPLHELVRPVVRGVRGDDELQLVRGVVEREQVLEPPLDHRLLVVGGDDHGHGRLDWLRRHPPRAHPGERGRR